MVVNCTIAFDKNPYGTYFAGQVLTGTVTLNLDQSKQVKGVLLKVHGNGSTQWTEDERSSTTDSNGNSVSATTTHSYSGNQDYIKTTTYLLGSKEANESIVIAPGTYTFTFTCSIPTACPTSFEGYYGRIRYLVKVVLVRPWKFNQTFTQGFTVLNILDLNYENPELMMSTESAVQKNFCCGPCKTAPLQLHMSIPQSGYVPGQCIPATVLVNNDSSIHVDGMKCELIMLVTYSCSLSVKTKTERIVVTTFKGEPVPRHCKKLFNYQLIVPATPPSCVNLCKYISITYSVEVEARVKGMHLNQVLSLPITIGNVPLMGVVQQQPTGSAGVHRALMSTADMNGLVKTEDGLKAALVQAKAADEKDMMVGYAAASPCDPWAADPSIAPPTYEEAVHGQRAKINADEQHDYGQSDFAPRYPVFNIPSPTTPTEK